MTSARRTSCPFSTPSLSRAEALPEGARRRDRRRPTAGFRVFATGNSIGGDGDGTYCGTQRLNAAFLNRFTGHGQAFEVGQSRYDPVVVEMRRGEVVEIEMRGGEPFFPYAQYGKTTVLPILHAPPTAVEEAWRIQPPEPLSLLA